MLFLSAFQVFKGIQPFSLALRTNHRRHASFRKASVMCALPENAREDVQTTNSYAIPGASILS